MFPRTLKAHKLKINTQAGRRLSSLHACVCVLPHHSYAMKTFIWQNRLAPALEQRIFDRRLVADDGSRRAESWLAS